ncbi:MAG TPA: solute carrier family 23 protein [Stellaceae bacterium]|nr:solute carrier family 23 protein [Stellaceae bacterium]
MRKPANIVYGAEEQPPRVVTLVSGVQHLAVIAIFMVYPLVIGHAARSTAAEIADMLRLCMLALAFAVLLQALPRGPVGSRRLAPSIFTGIYLAPSILAVKLGGLPLVWGMTIFAGLCETVLAQFWVRLRTLIPPESAGMVVFLVGVLIGLAGLHLLVGDGPGGSVAGQDALVTGITLAVMIGLNIWSKGPPRLFCILIGMACGYVAAAAVGLLGAHEVYVAVIDQPLLAVPALTHLSWSFNAELIIPFAVSGLASAMSSTAVITTYQRLDDADWVRPDMPAISRGVFADGLSTAAAGVLGTFGLTVSTANVGLAAATGVLSRPIGFVVAALLFLLAFQPNLIGVLVIMPPPVMAAALLFTAVFIMIGGVQIVSSRVLDPRRILVVGGGMMSFFYVSVFPNAFTRVPEWAQPLVTSPLVLATLVALGLNLVFRIGIRRTVRLVIEPATADLKEIGDFIERAAGVWGARRDVTMRVEFGIQQFIEAVIDHCAPTGLIGLSVSYDEFTVTAAIDYTGEAFELPHERPSEEEIIESEHGARRLAGFLVRNIADKALLVTETERHILNLVFEQ